MNKYKFFALIFVIFLAFDQITKIMVVKNLKYWPEDNLLDVETDEFILSCRAQKILEENSMECPKDLVDERQLEFKKADKNAADINCEIDPQNSLCVQKDTTLSEWRMARNVFSYDLPERKAGFWSKSRGTMSDYSCSETGDNKWKGLQETMRCDVDVIPGLFNFVHYHNHGAAFGIMQGQMVVFAVFTLIAIGFILYTLREVEEDDRFMVLILGLIASGAIGNAIDRTYYTLTESDGQGYVIDFLRLYATGDTATWLQENLGYDEWPAFNIADSAIVVGLILFFIHGTFFQKDNQEEDEDDGLTPPVLLDGTSES